MADGDDGLDITGLVLAGGRGARMGGVDKGLQLLDGVPLARHALHRLLPQVQAAGISANRNLAAYAAFGVPVWPDTLQDYPGPLAGFLAGLTHCQTPLMVTVPCDTPFFPEDLVARLLAALVTDGTDMAMACAAENGTGLRPQPVFCLMRRSLASSLEDFITQGGRRAQDWTSRHRTSRVAFDRATDVNAFANANTPDELSRLGLTGKPSVY